MNFYKKKKCGSFTNQRLISNNLNLKKTYLLLTVSILFFTVKLTLSKYLATIWSINSN